jgi:hypothetical protein
MTNRDEEVGQLYLDLVDQQLAQERDTRVSADQRALAVVTTSAALITLLLALAALRIPPPGTVVQGTFRPILLTGVAFLVLAAFLALLANRPTRQGRIDADELLQLARGEWAEESKIGVLRSIVITKCELLRKARWANGNKFRIILVAVLCEILGLALMAGAVAATLL